MNESTHAADPPRCPNCGTSAIGQFCAHCGQKQGIAIPGALDYLRELANHYVAVDGKLWRTLWLLLARPGLLTTEYIAGRRQRYIGPLKLYLTASVVFFVLVSLFAPPTVKVSAQLEPGTEEQQRVEQALDQLPAPLQQPLERAIAQAGRDTGAPAGIGRDIGRELGEQAPRAMFLLLPAFAGLTRLAFRRRPQHYATHLMFALHAHAMAFFALIAQLALPSSIDQGVMALLPLWLMFGFRRVFGGRWWALALRALWVSATYALLLLAAVVGGALLLAGTPG